jgi:hypothetical protein
MELVGGGGRALTPPQSFIKGSIYELPNFLETKVMKSLPRPQAVNNYTHTCKHSHRVVVMR